MIVTISVFYVYPEPGYLHPEAKGQSFAMPGQGQYLICLGSVTWGSPAAKSLFIGLGHSIQKTAKETFGVQVLFRILCKCRSACFDTEIIGITLIRVNRMGRFRVYVHSTHGILNHAVLRGNHTLNLPLKVPWTIYAKFKQAGFHLFQRFISSFTGRLGEMQYKNELKKIQNLLPKSYV